MYAAPFIQILYYHYEISFRTASLSRETIEALRPGPSDKFRYLPVVAPVLCLVCTILANAYSARIKVYMYYYTQESGQAIRQLLAAQKLLGGRHISHGRVAYLLNMLLHASQTLAPLSYHHIYSSKYEARCVTATT